MEYAHYARELIQHIETVVIGKEEQITNAVMTLLAKGHLLIEDIPGVGKTTLAKAMAQSIKCDFSRIQFTPDTLPGDVTGISIYNMQTGEFEYSKGAIMSQIVLADEINRTSPKTQASLLEAMEERQVTVDGKTYLLPQPFIVIATQNPMDYLGTYRLPEAQLDRFFMKISMGYPVSEAEEEMITRGMEAKEKKVLTPLLESETIIHMQEEVEKVMIHPDLVRYIVSIVNETRSHKDIVLGASPRASLALAKGAKVKAYVSGRDFVIPDDITYMIPLVLTHRLVLSAGARMNKIEVRRLLAEIIGRTKMPTI